MGARSAGGTAAARDRERWEPKSAWASGTLPHVLGGSWVSQGPTKEGGSCFLVTEGEDALTNVFVKADVCERYYRTIRNSLLMILEGTVRRQGRLINVLAEGAAGLQQPPSQEVIFLVEESPAGGYEDRALGYSNLTEAGTPEELKRMAQHAVRRHFVGGAESPHHTAAPGERSLTMPPDHHAPVGGLHNGSLRPFSICRTAPARGSVGA